MDDKKMDAEIAAMTEHMRARGLASHEFASLCAVSIGCLVALECDGNSAKAEAMGSLIRTARNWADIPDAH